LGLAANFVGVDDEAVGMLATKHLIGTDELRAMKPSAFLINTARGAIINEGELVMALQEGVIAGAGVRIND
jgi:phosphoglycerate dehydrogenase-like enzyme